MSNVVTDSMRDPGTPDDVVVTATAREPVTDPTLGIAVAATGGTSQCGFSNEAGAVFHTDLSWPAIVAWELGWYDQFRKPLYGGPGGLPLNIELLLRDLEHRFGADLDWWEFPLALFQGRQFMDRVEDYWERGPGSSFPNVTGISTSGGSAPTTRLQPAPWQCACAATRKSATKCVTAYISG